MKAQNDCKLLSAVLILSSTSILILGEPHIISLKFCFLVYPEIEMLPHLAMKIPPNNQK